MTHKFLYESIEKGISVRHHHKYQGKYHLTIGDHRYHLHNGVLEDFHGVTDEQTLETMVQDIDPQLLQVLEQQGIEVSTFGRIMSKAYSHQREEYETQIDDIDAYTYGDN